MLARKFQLSKSKSATLLTMERSRLTQARTLAQRRMDFTEVAEIDKKLEELNANVVVGATQPAASEEEDKLAKVNERNRKANLEAVRRAELVEAERKRKERKLAAMQGGETRNTDPSARLRTVPRVFSAATPAGSMPGSPVPGGTPTLGPTTALKADLPRQVSPLPSGKPGFIDVEVDLGDF